jgi:hypothetical protein
MIEVYPHRVEYELLLTAQEPISHHDPAVHDKSNHKVFNRQLQGLPCTELPAPSSQIVAWFSNQHLVPVDIAAIAEDLAFHEFVGVVIVKMFLDAYNHGDGVGIFKDEERYERLETRLHHAAISSSSLRQLWDRLCDTLCVPIHAEKADRDILAALALPDAIQQMVLQGLMQDYRSIVSIARLWNRTAKLENAEYAKKAGQEAVIEPKQVILFDALSGRDAGTVYVEVPAITANGLRHELVREPGWLRLFGQLGLRAARPGLGPVPAGCEAILSNGGNIEAGAHEPSGAFALKNQIRETYPILDLVGGCTDSFMLGESRLTVGSVLVCRENAPRLAKTAAANLPNARVSVYDMMDDVTITRSALQVGEGQGITSFETLAIGAQVVVRFGLQPFTRVVTHGALVDAVDAWQDLSGTICGQAARGFGHCTAEWLRRHEDADAYRQAYLDDVAANADALRAGLTSGTLCTKNVVLT